MAFDRQLAEASRVEVLDALNGNRVVGTGFRLTDDTIATSCRCLPRPAGKVLLPDPESPSTPVLVRVRRPGASEVAFAVVAVAEPFSGIALLRSTTGSGVGVPDELNPDVPAARLIAGLEPMRAEPEPWREGPVFILTHEGRWVEGTARGSTVRVREPDVRIDGATIGAPVFAGDGRVVGVVGVADGTGPDVEMILLAEHLPGWALPEKGRYES